MKKDLGKTALRKSKELTNLGIDKFKQAAEADGADISGLTSLLYVVMFNYAVDAVLMVGLANTLFFSAATAESKSNVALYLLVNIAPFAVIAPLIGPMLDKLQKGRRLTLAASFFLRTLICLILIKNSYFPAGASSASFPAWILYPCALGMMVLSKSFSVLKAAITPRVIPVGIDLVQTNARLTTFGLIGGSLGGLFATLFEVFFGKGLHQPGALYFNVALTAVAGVACFKIPKWVEVTEGEIPTTLIQTDIAPTGGSKKIPLGPEVISPLWSTVSIRGVTGFLTLYVAFVSKSSANLNSLQMALIVACIGGAGVGGNFLGNILSARISLTNPSKTAIWCGAATLVAVLLGAIIQNLWFVTIIAAIASLCSAIAKASLDAAIQTNLPEDSRASAFGRSETLLQLGWVTGAAAGVMLPPNLLVGFGVIFVIALLIYIFALKNFSSIKTVKDQSTA